MNEMTTTPDDKKQIVKANKFLARAIEYKINTHEIAQKATDAMVVIQSLYNQVEKARKDEKEEPRQECIRIDNDYRGPLDVLKKAKTTLKQKCIVWNNALEAKRLAIQAEAQERARKEREKLEKRAAYAAEKGKKEKAEVLQIQAAAVLTPVIAPLAPKLKGLTIQKRWYAEVLDEDAVIQGVADGKIPKMGIIINKPFFDSQAVADREEMNYPGVVARWRQV